MSLKAFKKNSDSFFDNLNKKVSAIANPQNNNADDRFWTLKVDKAGNGYAVFRWLPGPTPEDVPFVQYYDHGFKGPGGWYIEKSRTSLGKDTPDPVSEYNSSVWGTKEGKDFVSGTPDNPGSKRRLHFVAKIEMIDDPADPSINGKVKLFKFGKRIFDKVNNMMNPKFPDQPRINPFDPYTGANFTLRASVVDGQRNYNESSFAAQTPIAPTDAKIEEVLAMASEYDLNEFIDPANFKSYDELLARLNRVLKTAPTRQTVEEDEDIPFEKPASPLKTLSKPVASKEKTPPWEEFESDDELNEFRKLING